MVIVKCPYRDCDYETDDVSSEVVVTLLNIHKMNHEQQSSSRSQEANVSVPKLDRPHVDMGVDQEAWLAFIRRWETFRVGSNIGEGTAAFQLFHVPVRSSGTSC